MADSLVLKGVKDVRKHTGTEMLLTNPRRGGNTHQVKEWWRKSVNTTYAACTIFDVTTADGTVKLVLATGKSEDADIRIDHDGSFNFSFYQINEIERAALFTDAMELIEHYVFPSIAGGPVMTVTPPSGASRPSAPRHRLRLLPLVLSPWLANRHLLMVTLRPIQLALCGDASPTYVLTSSDTNDTVSGLDVTYSGTGTRTLTVTATDAAASDNPATGTLAINTQESFADKVAGADVSVAVTVADTGNGNKYQIDGVEQAEITANATETIHFDLSDASLSGSST